MQFLVIADIPDHGRNKLPNFKELLQQEVDGTIEGYLDGTLRQVWLQDPGDGAVALMEAGSLAEAEAIVARWPLEKAGILATRLIALKPFAGFAPR